jgi:hypothetical protein
MNPKLLQKQLERFATDRWARRGIRGLIRATWLGLSFWSFWLGGHLLFGWPLDYLTLEIVVLVCIAVGALLLLRPRMKSREVARRLDQRFGLEEQMTTAEELSATLPEGSKPEGVASYLLWHARHNSHQIHRYARTKQMLPWAEIVALFAAILMAVGMFLLIHINQPVAASVQPAPLPPPAGPGRPPVAFPNDSLALPQGDTAAPDGRPGQGEGETGQGKGGGEGIEAGPGTGSNQQAISALADALRDLSITRPVADALDEADTAGAARTLREIADQADQLSQKTRHEIAEALRQAATDIGPTDGELANDIRDSAFRLERDKQQAAQSLEDLANMVEQLGGQQPGVPAQSQPPPAQQGNNEQPQDRQDPPQGAPGGAGNTPLPGDQHERKPDPAERLDVEGVPLELEGGPGDEERASDSEQDGPPAQVEPVGGGSGFEQDAATLNDEEIQAGADPLRIPPDLRHVVQTYFSPAE